MLRSDMNERERKEYPQGRCGLCGIGIDHVERWDGDDYGYALLCACCGHSVKEKRKARRG